MHEPNAPTPPTPTAEPHDGPEEDQIATEKMPLIPSATESPGPWGDGGPTHGTGAAPYPVSANAEDGESVGAEDGVSVGAEDGVSVRAEGGEPAVDDSKPAIDDGAAAPAPVADPHTPSPLDLAMDVLGRLQTRMRAQVLGRDDVVDLVLVALLADGHVLLEDFPGSGKTTLAKSLGQSIVDGRPETETGGIVPFRRVQFTPDLLPSDVTGVSVFDAQSHGFHFRHGPVFAHVVLADEINRTSPKVQSSLLEAMAEKQVTVDNVTYPLDDLFFVIATQNPLDLAGTYPLPVAQLDRFLFKIRMDHIDRDSELAVLDTYRERRDVERTDLPKVGREEVIRARRAVDEHVVIDRRVKECLVDLAQIVRDDPRVMQGCSTRSLVLMLPALQALAALRGRDYVSADDIQALVPRVLGHRVELAPGLSDLDEVLGDALASAIEGLSRATLSRGTPSRGTSPRGTGPWGG